MEYSFSFYHTENIFTLEEEKIHGNGSLVNKTYISGSSEVSK